jgi:aspartate ammonia-lyase
MANDQAVTLAAASGEFELNAFLPLIADALLESLSLLARAVELFRVKCVELIEPDRERCARWLDASLAFAAAYAVRLGHERVARLMAEHGDDPVRLKAALDAAAAEPR